MLMNMDPTVICAQLSDMIYDGVVSAEGCEVETFEVGKTYAAIFSNETTAYVVFRGSNDAWDFRMDARFIKVPWPVGGRVHRGFKRAFDDIWPVMSASIYKHHEKRMFVTGHSLGGALAQLAASTYRFDWAYVFGCPRVGNQAFVDTVLCDGVRFENTPDPITHVPLKWGPVQALWALSHLRMPSVYQQPWEAVDLIGSGHGMQNYLDGLGIT